MHEITLLESVLKILENNAESENYTSVKKISLEIGQLCGVDMHALRLGFDVVMKNTLAENAELEIIKAEGMGVCQQCRKMVFLARSYDECTHCGSANVQITQGTELKVKDLIVL